MFLSIVIPCYNSEKTIIPLLSSIFSSEKVDFREIETVSVDDDSKDRTQATILKFIKDIKRRRTRFKSQRLIVLKKNSGPAHARNIGVSAAKGKVILFLDSDVILYKNTLFEVIRSFREDPDLFALTGVWDKKQKKKNYFPKFKALRDWSYWINERNPRDYYYLFSTRIAAIDRKLFLRLGGFDETYKAALVEDIELTYRIARRYAVVFNPKVIVHHEFEDFLPVARKYFWRSFYWSKIYRERKKFDPVATTSKEAVTTITAGGVVVLSLLSFLSHLSNLREMRNGFLAGLGAMLLIHLWGVRKFLSFTAREEGPLFAVRAFFTGMVLYLVILGGASVSILMSVIPLLNKQKIGERKV